MDFSIDESPAVKALGPLFKLTEVHLWDCGSSEVPESIKLSNGDKDYVEETNGFCSITEELELARQMNDLGLPLSFHTNKETRYGKTSGKSKGTRKSKKQSLIESSDHMVDSINADEDEIKSPDSLHNISAMLDESDTLRNGILAEVAIDSLCSTVCTGTLYNEHEYNVGVSDCGIPEGSWLVNEGADGDGKGLKIELCSAHLEARSVTGHETDGQSNDASLEMIKNSNENANSREWIAYWDNFHMRTYFYNIQTEESTWDRPSGMEHLVHGNSASEPTNERMDFGTSEAVEASCGIYSPHGMEIESRNDGWSLSEGWDGITEDWPFTDNVCSTKSTKKKKKARKTKSKMKISVSSEDIQGILHEVPPSISKYWRQRYLLFSRFDNGIKMDEEGWFSVTPEPLAKHHAFRCCQGAIVDFFTGVGGNAIQFAQRRKHVIAIDIDPIKIDFARHNATIYGVDDRIDFIKGDSFSLAPKLKANMVFMSPPWGGPAYSKVKKFDINTMLKPREGQFLFNAGKEIAPNIVMFLPRNVDINQLAELSLSATPPWSLEVERNFLNGRLKAITAYFSEPSRL